MNHTYTYKKTTTVREKFMLWYLYASFVNTFTYIENFNKFDVYLTSICSWIIWRSEEVYECRRLFKIFLKEQVVDFL